MIVLLTSGAGMVGKNILEHRPASKYEFISPDRTELKLFSFEALKAYVAKVKPDFIIHVFQKKILTSATKRLSPVTCMVVGTSSPGKFSYDPVRYTQVAPGKT